MMVILHLSHTDINSDSRILKEMNSLRGLSEDVKISGIGLQENESGSQATHSLLDINTIVLKSRSLHFLINPIRHLLLFSELFFRMFFLSIRKKPNVIHCHDVVVLPIALAAKFVTGAKLIYDAHELESLKNGNTKMLTKLIYFAERIAWSFIDGLIVVSSSIEKWYHEHLGLKESAVILNAPVIERTSSYLNNQYLREKYNIPSDKKIFLYVGILTAGRGIDLILSAFRDEKVNSHLVFLGYGDMFNSLNEVAKNNPRIHVHEAVKHDRVTEIASSADFGFCLIQNVSLSDYYSLPNKLFEYAFAGIKIIGSDFPEIASVVRKYDLGECVQLDRNQILDTVLKVELQPSYEKKVSQSVKADLSWDAQSSKLRSLYTRVMVTKT